MLALPVEIQQKNMQDIYIYTYVCLLLCWTEEWFCFNNESDALSCERYHTERCKRQICSHCILFRGCLTREGAAYSSLLTEITLLPGGCSEYEYVKSVISYEWYLYFFEKHKKNFQPFERSSFHMKVHTIFVKCFFSCIQIVLLI